MKNKSTTLRHASPFKSTASIITELREISTHEGTYELLAELFFEFVVHEMENDPPVESRIRQIRNLRYDVFRLFELARAVKEMDAKRC